MTRHLLSITDLAERLDTVLESALAVKADPAAYRDRLNGQSLAMIFEKSSTRTRVSFEVAMTQLGGHALCLSPKDLQMGRGETVADTGKVLSRYVEAIMYRAFDWRVMEELAAGATVPVLNGLDDREHPCQCVADLLTIRERFGTLAGRKLAYVGDGNNVLHSLLLGGAMMGMHVAAACPVGYWPWHNMVARAEVIAAETGGSIALTDDPAEAAADAHAVYTDVWVSMGDEAEQEQRLRLFRPYRLDTTLMGKARDDAIALHCLPAHRGVEITDNVLDGTQSAVWDQAENRLHAQKALLLELVA